MFGCARTRDGKVECWGLNDKGQLGTGDEKPRSAPTIVAGLPGVAHLSASAEAACALGREGEVFCWGSNLYRAIGDRRSGAPAHVTTPMRVAVP
jgi:alpha-tubulin suppressor-like RCC1 family protein